MPRTEVFREPQMEYGLGKSVQIEATDRVQDQVRSLGPHRLPGAEFGRKLDQELQARIALGAENGSVLRALLRRGSCGSFKDGKWERLMHRPMESGTALTPGC